MFGFDVFMSIYLWVVSLVSLYFLVSSGISFSKAKGNKEVKFKAKEHLTYVFVGVLFVFCFYTVSILPEHV